MLNANEIFSVRFLLKSPANGRVLQSRAAEKLSVQTATLQRCMHRAVVTFFLRTCFDCHYREVMFMFTRPSRTTSGRRVLYSSASCCESVGLSRKSGFYLHPLRGGGGLTLLVLSEHFQFLPWSSESNVPCMGCPFKKIPLEAQMYACVYTYMK